MKHNPVLMRRLMAPAWLLPHDTRRLLFRAVAPRAFSKLHAMRTADVSRGRALKGFDDWKCIFVHIPKCAGTSVSRSLFGNQGGAHLHLAHYQLLFDAREFAEYFKFTFVRNPWDRLVSAFHFLKDGGLNDSDRAWARENLSAFDDFHSFVDKWVSPRNVGSWKHFAPQHVWVCEPGSMVPKVDFIGYFEHMAEDFEQVRRRLGHPTPLVHVNKNESRKKDYREYYTPEARSKVADVYAEDIELFGYDFDNALLAQRRTRAATMR